MSDQELYWYGNRWIPPPKKIWMGDLGRKVNQELVYL